MNMSAAAGAMVQALTTKLGSEGGNAANWAMLRAVTTKLGRKAGSVVGNAAGADYEGGERSLRRCG